MEEMIYTILLFIVGLIFLWFTYTVINNVVTIFRCRKRDNSLSFCFNTAGKVFYAFLTVLYVVIFVGGVYAFVYGLLKDNSLIYRNALNAVAFMTVVYAYNISAIVLVGRKYMMVGRMEIDYRKLKKVNYSYNNRMSFVYAQKEYNFSTRFVDLTELRKRISK